MDTYLKSISIAVVGICICLILSKNAKDYSNLVAIILCCALCVSVIVLLEPIIEFMLRLENIAGNNTGWLKILLKTVGLSVIGETVSLICNDAGQTAVGKMIQLLTTIAILWTSLPLIQNLIELISSILEML